MTGEVVLEVLGQSERDQICFGGGMVRKKSRPDGPRRGFFLTLFWYWECDGFPPLSSLVLPLQHSNEWLASGGKWNLKGEYRYNTGFNFKYHRFHSQNDRTSEARTTTKKAKTKKSRTERLPDTLRPTIPQSGFCFKITKNNRI